MQNRKKLKLKILCFLLETGCGQCTVWSPLVCSMLNVMTYPQTVFLIFGAHANNETYLTTKII